jgi:hypothetical protein
VADDPVNLTDPSGHDFDSMIDLSSEVMRLVVPQLVMNVSSQGGLVSLGGTLAFGVDVYVWDRDVPSVGHVMATKHNSHTALISQFPFKDKAHHEEGTLASHLKGTGYNGLASFNDTFRYEGRTPSHRYSVLVPNATSFNATASQQRAATYWNWRPTSADETQCSTAVFLSLKAGGVPFGSDANYTSGLLWPNTFDNWMMEDSKNSVATGVTLLP